MSGRASYAETLYSLAEWSEGHFRIRAKEARPYVMTDPNDRMGVTRNDEGPGRDRKLFPEREGQAASLFRDLVQEEGMAVINTFQGRKAKFASTR